MRSLTKLETQTLSQYLHFREQPPTFRRLFVNRTWARALAIYGVLLGLMYYGAFAIVQEPGLRILAVFFTGYVLGAIMQAVAILGRFRKIWPLLSQVLNWTAVERTLAEGMPDAEGESPFAPQPSVETGNPFQSPRS